MTDVFIAVGSIDYEFDDVIGVFATYDEARQHCDRTPTYSGGTTRFDRYSIQQWPVGGTEVTASWARDGEETEWRASK